MLLLYGETNVKNETSRTFRAFKLPPPPTTPSKTKPLKQLNASTVKNGNRKVVQGRLD